MLRRCKPTLVGACLALVVVAGLLQHADGPVCAASDAEESAILQRARLYLDAEIRGDLKSVYALLAPSSGYVAQNSYEVYAAEAKASPVRILEYKILRVHLIRDNHDPKAFPKVEKFAQVEVDLKLFFSDIGKSTEVNYDFTFIKENGHWYKG